MPDFTMKNFPVSALFDRISLRDKTFLYEKNTNFVIKFASHILLDFLSLQYLRLKNMETTA